MGLVGRRSTKWVPTDEGLAFPTSYPGMSTQPPVIVGRDEQPYVGVHQNVTMDELSTVADAIPELLGWLSGRAISPAGPPFFKYNLIDMSARLSVEIGVPTSRSRPGDDHVHAGLLPAGRYVTAIHVGPPSTLVGAVRELRQWASAHDLRWDMTETPSGERWGCRMESYLTDPRVQPDQTKWETELAFRLAD
jgi:effector-binding domain-containing protein